MIKSYAGIGSRSITNEEKEFIESISNILRFRYVCYSGNAEGSDIAFQTGSKGKCVIFIPWRGFNKLQFDYECKEKCMDYFLPTKESYNSIFKYHPNPMALNRGGTSLMARNYHQVMGYEDKYPIINFIICCADQDKDGNILGGTGQACRIAKDNDIPVINIRNLIQKEKLKKLLGIS